MRRIAQPRSCPRPGWHGLPLTAAEVLARVPGLPLRDAAFPQPRSVVGMDPERLRSSAVGADTRVGVPGRVLGRHGEHVVGRL